jgi:hypothetical protein
VPSVARWTRLEDLLDWILLVEAVALRPDMQSWAAVAHSLGVHERSLARSARRFLNSGLRNVAAAASEILDDDSINRMLCQFFGPMLP